MRPGAAISSVTLVKMPRQGIGEYYVIIYTSGRCRFCYSRAALPIPVKQFLIGLEPTTTTAADGAIETTWKET